MSRRDNFSTDLNNGLRAASSGGHMDIVQLLIAKGADDWNRALKGASLGGHMDIVRYLQSKIDERQSQN